MSSPIKKTTVEDLQKTLEVICIKADELFLKSEGKDPIWSGFNNFKAFIKNIERTAIKEAAQELGIANNTARDRWLILTLPTPVYNAIESEEVSFSKCKPMTSINFDFEKDEDIQVAQEIVDKIKTGIAVKEIKEVVKEYAPKIWNEKDIVIRRIAEQHGLTA